jgi:arginine/ornithine N-succinyltransferase beta subunit
VIGVASVRGAIGVARPHFSFRVVKLAQHSNAAGVNFEHEALVLVNECAGPARSARCSSTPSIAAAATARCWRHRATC